MQARRNAERGAAQAVGDIPESVTQTLLARIRDSATNDMVAQWAERFGRTAIVEGHIKKSPGKHRRRYIVIGRGD